MILTKREFELMNLLWIFGPLSVAQAIEYCAQVQHLTLIQLRHSIESLKRKASFHIQDINDCFIIQLYQKKITYMSI